MSKTVIKVIKKVQPQSGCVCHLKWYAVVWLYLTSLAVRPLLSPGGPQCLHDVCALKGQLVVLECRLRGTPPLQVMWSREDQHIQDSDDFRILRKSQ